MGTEAPGLFAAALTLVNMAFAWKYLTESNESVSVKTAERPVVRTSGTAVLRVATHPRDPASRLIWIYAIAMGAFQGMTAVLALFLWDRFGIDETKIGWVFMYIGILSVVARAILLGPAV